MRLFATLLIAVLAFVPPGICLCRLTAALVPGQQAVPQEHECPDDEHECDCPQIMHDCTVEAAMPDLAPTQIAALVVAAGVAVPSATSPDVIEPHAACPSPTPIYLAVRALRI